MSWLAGVTSIITSVFPLHRKLGVTPPPALSGARVTYTSEGRSGRVIFTHGLRSFDMYFEFGGGDTLAIIDVPAAKEWTTRTGFPAALRPAILEFIGQSVVRDQTTQGRGRFVIHEDAITLHA